MKKITFSGILLFLMILSSTSGFAQLLLDEQFNYNSGTLLSANGWTAFSGAGTTPATVAPASIFYSGYKSSGVGQQASVTGTGEDDYLLMSSAVTTGTVYASFLINVASGNTNGDYVVFLGNSTANASYFRARFFAKVDANKNVYFGIAQKSTYSAANFSTTAYSLNTTYLVVIKYTFDGTANGYGETASFVVNPTLYANEPTSWTTSTDVLSGTAYGLAYSVGGGMKTFCIRQSTTTPSCKIDGIRVSQTWSDIVGSTTESYVTFDNQILPFAWIYADHSTNEEKLFNVTGGTNLTGDLSVTAPTNFEISTTSGSGFSSSLSIPSATVSSATTPIYVRPISTVASGTYTEYITLSTAGAVNQKVQCQLLVKPAVPTLYKDSTSLRFSGFACSTPGTNSFKLNGDLLTDNISISFTGTDAALFSVSPATIAPVSGTVSSTAVTVTYAPTSLGSHTATLVISTPGAATNQTIILTGTATTPRLNSLAATNITSSGFTANWEALTCNSTAYTLNVYQKTIGSTVNEINDFASAPTGWTLTGSSVKNSTLAGTTAPSHLYLNPTGAEVVTKDNGTADYTSISFKVTADPLNPGKTSYMAVFGYDGTNWYNLKNITVDNSLAPSTLVQLSQLPPFLLKIKFTNTQASMASSRAVYVDSVKINYTPYTKVPVGTFTVNDAASYEVTGLSNASDYFYNVISTTSTSYISNEIKVTTDLGTGFKKTISSVIYSQNGNVMVNAVAGQQLEIYNTLGQKVVSQLTTEGLNTIALTAKGVVIVKLDNKVAKINL